MKRITVTLFALLLLFAPAAQAQENRATILDAKQVAKIDFTGKWTGKRQQYAWDKQSFIEVFEYEFDLKQEGDIVTGTTTIVSANGDYADMKLEGIVIGNKLHFREVEVTGAIRPEGKVWCFKSGELNVAIEGNNLKLIGATNSYMEDHYYPCSGGYTDLVKVESATAVNTINTSFLASDVTNKADMEINVFPNPFITDATVYYTVNADADVKVEVYDISGKAVSSLFEGNQAAGRYNVSFNGKNAGYQSGVFIVKLSIGDEVYSRQIVQMR